MNVQLVDELREVADWFRLRGMDENAALLDHAANVAQCAANFFAWYNKYYPAPSSHPHHPWCVLGASLIPDKNDSARAALLKETSNDCDRYEKNHAVQPMDSTTLEQADDHAHICSKLAEQYKSDPVLFAALTDAAAIIRDLMRGRLQASKSAQTAWQRGFQQGLESNRGLATQAMDALKKEREAHAETNRAMTDALLMMEEREQRDEALLRQALEALERGASGLHRALGQTDEGKSLLEGLTSRLAGKGAAPAALPSLEAAAETAQQ